MRKKQKSGELEAIEAVGRSIIMLDPAQFLDELTCSNDLHEAMAYGVLALAGWTIKDVFEIVWPDGRRNG
jgi:hypothetical protein